MTGSEKIKSGSNGQRSLTIVGIGASAGGLAALKTFFSHVPEDSGLAFVVVVHLSPKYKSVLAELLQPHMNIPVEQVSTTTALEPNHVYVIPPNANLNTIDTHLRLSELEEKLKDRAPVDHFFRTLAKTHDGNSIGIILSGTGTDGTLGLKEIKEKGGLTLVQDPKEAEYDGMPLSAISTGLIDKVLTLNDMPDYCIKFASTHPKIKSLLLENEPEDEERQLIQKLFLLIRARTGRDFSHYKISTILRRLKRRMQINQIESLPGFMEFLKKSPEELNALSDDFLVNVTTFFRDSKMFDYLGEEILPKLFDQKKPNEHVRVWSVGCATGEEAYSLAMLLHEEALNHEAAPMIQVFATDLHYESLKKAREGYYPGEIESDVEPERRRKFFIKENGGYRVRKEIREHVIFTPHNLLADPPFSKIDLLLCRNLLIYLKKETQKDIFQLFHYAIMPDGTLVLGTSEHPEKNDLFGTINKELSIYNRRNIPGPEPRLPFFPMVPNLMASVNLSLRGEQPQSFGALHQKAVERYGPPSLLLSHDLLILHVSQHAGRYLVVPGGEPSREIFKLIRHELIAETHTIISSAQQKKTYVRSRPASLSIDGQERKVILSARVIDDVRENRLILLSFEEYDSENLPDITTAEGKNGPPENARMKELELEVEDYRQRMQSLIEQYETGQEEMKASNEELQSANEELRSTMEELETSKEELQSMNEELSTLNQENRHKVEELAQLSDDLQNLLIATDIATLFLDRQMRILRFTPKLSELFNVREADKGRIISDQTHKLGYDKLIHDAQNVLKTLQPLEREVMDSNNKTFLTRIMPYRSAEDRIEGVVLTFVDITRRKNAEDSLLNSLDRITLTLDSLGMGAWEITEGEKAGFIDERGIKLLGLPPGTRDISLDTFRKIVHKDDRDRINKQVKEAWKNQGEINEEFRIKTADQIRWLVIRARVVLHQGVRRMIGVNFDITERKMAEEKLSRSLSEQQSQKDFLQRLIDNSPIAIAVVSEKDFIISLVNPTFQAIIGPETPMVGEPYGKIFPEAASLGIAEGLHRVIRDGVKWKIRDFKTPMGDRKETWWEGEIIPLQKKNEKTREALILTWEITERVLAEKALRDSEARRIIAFEATNIGDWRLNLNTNELYWSDKVYELLGLDKSVTPSLKNAISIIHPEDRERVLKMIEKGRGPEMKGNYELEYRVVHPDKVIWLNSRARRVEQNHGTPGADVMLYGAIIDISDIKNSEEAMYKAKEEAERAAMAKEEFLAHMSHEIRTPLNAIVGLSHLMLQQHPRKDQLENLTNLKYSAESLHILINDILDLSKIQAGKMTIEKEEVSLPELMHNIIRIHKSSAGEKNLKLELKLDRKIPATIITEQLKLTQILNNLLSNAIKFTAEGKVILKAALNRKEDKLLLIDFSVHDTGIGIPKDKLEDIFDVFSQGDNSTARKFGGTGLGLTLCRLYLQMLDSEIKVESEVNKGSKFFFTLPVVEGDHEALQKDASEISFSHDELKKFKILFVEDSQMNRMVIRQFLQNWWHLSCVEASNGEQAIARASAEHFDIILMDVRMPVMDGFHATREIRKIPGYSGVPIIALTADVSEKVRNETSSGLFDDILIKPVKPGDLLKKLMKHASMVPGSKTPAPPVIENENLTLNKVFDYMENDTGSIRIFLEKTTDEIEGIKEKYGQTIDAKDKDAFFELNHKYHWVFDLLEVKSLGDHFRYTLNLLQEGADDDVLKKARQDGLQMLTQLKKELEKKVSLIGEV